MATSQQPAYTHSPPPRIAIKLKPHAHKLQREDGDHITKLFRKTSSGLELKHHVKPLVDPQRAIAVAQKVAEAARRNPKYKAVNFDEWYQVHFDSEQLKSINDEVPDGHAATRALQRHAHKLHDEDDVESAQVVGILCPPPTVKWQDDPRAKNQGYLDPAPAGIDVKYAWGFKGGDGAGTNVVDIERGWDLDHEDLVSTASAVQNSWVRRS